MSVSVICFLFYFGSWFSPVLFEVWLPPCDCFPCTPGFHLLLSALTWVLFLCESSSYTGFLLCFMSLMITCLNRYINCTHPLNCFVGLHWEMDLFTCTVQQTIWQLKIKIRIHTFWMCIFDLFIIKFDIQITEYSQEKEQKCRMLVDALKIHKIGKTWQVKTGWNNKPWAQWN